MGHILLIYQFDSPSVPDEIYVIPVFVAPTWLQECHDKWLGHYKTTRTQQQMLCNLAEMLHTGILKEFAVTLDDYPYVGMKIDHIVRCGTLLL